VVAFIGTVLDLPQPMNACSHLAEFFSGDERLVERVADFLQEGFETGSTCIAVLTSHHRARVDAVLATRGFISDELVADYRYIVIDAPTALNSIRSGGGFNVEEFHRSFGQLISLAASGGKQVRIVGEMVTLLAEQGEADAVIQLEELWNDLSRVHSFTLYCVYADDVCKRSLGQRERNQISTLHSRIPATA
jgi:KaiC/GvpD/RAD55 family RecA-like ATPase